jgi:hypothetical protein
MKKGLLFVLVLIFGVLVFQTTAQQTAPAKPDSWRFLTSCVGAWEGPAIHKSATQTVTYNYRTVFKSALDGMAMTMDESADIPGGGSLRGMHLIGCDPEDGRIHWFAVDNMGTAHEHVGEMAGENRLRLVYDGKLDGRSYREDIDMFHAKSDEIVLKIVFSEDGKQTGQLDCKFALIK